MEYRIRIKAGKESAFLQIIRALQSLGLIESIEQFSPEDVEKHGKSDANEEFASQYRDLVD